MDEAHTTGGIDGSLARTGAPVANRHPFVYGTAQVGQTLGDEVSEWLNGPTAFGYQWLRCDAAGGSCQPIAGATGRRYVVTAVDAGDTLRIVESASNELGAGVPVTSGPSKLVPGASAEPPSGPPPTPQGGKPSGSTGVLTSTSSAPSTKQILGALLAALAPGGKGARIANVRKHGTYSLTFNAPAAGTLTISWYLVPKGAHLSASKHPNAVLVATASAVAKHAGKLTVTVRLNGKGKALIKHAKALKLTAKGSFKIAGRTALTTTKTFVLH